MKITAKVSDPKEHNLTWDQIKNKSGVYESEYGSDIVIIEGALPMGFYIYENGSVELLDEVIWKDNRFLKSNKEVTIRFNHE